MSIFELGYDSLEFMSSELGALGIIAQEQVFKFEFIFPPSLFRPFPPCCSLSDLSYFCSVPIFKTDELPGNVSLPTTVYEGLHCLGCSGDARMPIFQTGVAPGEG